MTTDLPTDRTTARRVRDLIERCTADRVRGDDLQGSTPIGLGGPSAMGGVELDSIEIAQLLVGIEDLTRADPEAVVEALRRTRTLDDICACVDALAATRPRGTA
jgi:hypothetical protein